MLPINRSSDSKTLDSIMKESNIDKKAQTQGLKKKIEEKKKELKPEK